MNRIRVDHDGAVGRIVLARPEKKNALDLTAALELQEALDAFAANDDVRVVLLDADGADFCAGADLGALHAMVDAGAEAHDRDARALGDVFRRIRRMPQPVIAEVRGRALAGGAGLAIACDIVIARDDAQFGFPEVRVGFVPAMVMTILRRQIGEKRAFELVASGRRVAAREALELGLVSRIIGSADFDGFANRLAGEMSSIASSALRMTKKLFYDLDGHGFDDGIDRGIQVNVAARATTEFRESVRAFAPPSE